MSYWEELWIFKKKDARYHFYKKIPIDDPSALHLGDSFVLKSKNGNERKFRIDRLEHLITLQSRKLDKYDDGDEYKENEYWLKIYVSR